MTIKWTLRLSLAKRGIFTMAELGRLLEDRAGYPLTPPALHRLAGGKTGEPPREIKLATLNALLDALDFPATDFGIFHYEPPTAANQAAQPLVVNSDVHPTRHRKQSDDGRRTKKVRRTEPPDAE
jgi:hypothetical protein